MKTLRNITLFRNNRGFTLIEILIATTLFAVVVGALYSVFYGAMRLRERAYQKFEKAVPKSYALERIKMDLSNATPPGGILAGDMISQKTEKGNQRSDTLEFYSSAGIIEQNYPWGDVMKIMYYLGQPLYQDTRGYDLIRATTRNLLTTDEDTPDEYHMLSGVESLEFSFYDKSSATWLDSWDSTANENLLPTAIRVRLTFSTPDNKNIRNVKDIEEVQPPAELIVPIITVSASATPTPSDSSSSSEENNNNNNPGGTGNNSGNTGGTGGGRP